MADEPAAAEPDRAADDVMKLVSEHDVRFIRLWFTDVLGQLKSFSINSVRARRRVRGRDGLRRLVDHRLQPDRGVGHDRDARPGTFAILPWRPDEKATARMFCDVQVPGGDPYEGDPRWIMRRALKRAEDLGFDNYNIGPELEYFYFKDARAGGRHPRDPRRGRLLRPDHARRRLRRPPRDDPRARAARDPRRVRAPRGRALPARGRHALQGRARDVRRLHDLPDHGQGVRDEVRLARDLHAEAAVRRERLRHARPPVARRKDGRNAFYDPDDQYFLSDTAKAFIAGQLRHAREISSLFAQWVNSYKRLVPGYEAPVYLAWSRRNRSALIRVPLYHPGKEGATRAELRCPDPACNPYLCFAGMLHAGLEGIEKGYELPEPMEQNLYHLTPEERAQRGIEQLPETLGEAIEIAAESELVLRILGEHTFKRFIEIKREEWEEYRVQVTPWEIERFLPIL